MFVRFTTAITCNRKPQGRRHNGRPSLDRHDGGTTVLQLALAWGFVGIPLAWGVLQTLSNALKLFQ
jgi:hypothetical protein